METARRRLMQNQPLGTEGFTTAPSSPRSTIPLPRRNATPAQTTSHQSPTQPQHRPGASVASSPPGPSTSIPLAAGSAVAPIARAASPARTGEKLSTPYLTCKQWDVQDMVKTHSNFRPVRRVSALAPPAELLRELAEYEKSGLPLIIEDWHKHPGWKGELLGIDWLLANVGDKEIPVRNVHNRKDTTMKMSRFVEVSRAQDVHHVSGESERYYWKDGECPSQWKDWLQGVLPAPILPGSRDDLLRHLLPSESVETLLCYLGVGDTYTPAHKDLCASSGHNLMCFSEDDGSSFWFMTASDSAPQVAEYFQKELRQELDWETHVTTVDEWGRADFNVYVAEQKVGDLVLVPPRSVHQVVNRGGLAMKLSWSRMAPTNLKTALWSELPIYRRVCRPEQYRVKTVLYRSLLHYADELRSALGEGAKASNKSARSGLVEYGSSIDSHEDDENPFVQPPQTNEQLAIELWRLVHLFDDVLKQEHASCHDKLEHITRSETSSRWSLSANDTGRKHTRIAPPSPAPEHGSDRKSSYNLACDFCGADIFQSFFECQRCRAEDDEEAQIGDGLLVCPACYVEGRTCSCDDMHPRQCRPFDVLLQDRNEAASLLSRAPLPPNKRGGEATSPLLEKHLKGRDTIRVFEAACALRDMKNNTTVEMSNTTRRCRISVKSLENHYMPIISGLRCSMCHSAKCYIHLLSAGTHCAEALLASRVSDAFYHEVHKNNAAGTKQRPPTLYDVRGSDVQERLVVAAKSFPRCKPGHSKLQLGWYDNEFQASTVLRSSSLTTHLYAFLSGCRPHPRHRDITPSRTQFSVTKSRRIPLDTYQ
ncbi:hypothetical protein K466DRAFT_87058 [Polyporus arcularius HHB13444]|uniref:JmjC domain-containing protein n=1 Tax=Polyporus arcularius HHB13444 TaxID=1314778 RepID=A0A5C3PGE5_9APHY|nr:hypothetical protein K466DRAFT_87058 [Polyporus arcularius HHB13444]